MIVNTILYIKIQKQQMILKIPQ